MSLIDGIPYSHPNLILDYDILSIIKRLHIGYQYYAFYLFYLAEYNRV